MKEVWKNIKGYEGLYKVSNLGRVKSLKRKSKWRGTFRQIKERILKPRLSKGGYLTVLLCKEKQITKYIQLLVWDVFGGNKRDGRKIQVDHKNSIKIDNRFDNLQLLTQRKNISKRFQDDGKELPTGVCYDRQRSKYLAQITIDGSNNFLGRHLTVEDASNAYQNALAGIGE